MYVCIKNAQCLFVEYLRVTQCVAQHEPMNPRRPYAQITMKTMRLIMIII